MLSAFYLVLLSITVLSIQICRRTSKDIASILAALTAILSFFWGFVIAPLLVKLLIVTLLMRIDKFYLDQTKLLT